MQRLRLAFGAGDIAFRLLDLFFQRDRRLLHAVECLQLEGIDSVHRIIDVLERTAERFERDGCARRLFVNPCGIVAQQCAGAVDDTRRGGVERGYLVEHKPLVGHRLRDCHRRTQRADRGGRRPVDTLYQLDIVLFYQIECQIALHRHRHLCQQILRALAHIEQRAFLDRFRFGRIGQFEFDRLFLKLCVELLRHHDHLFEPAHRRPQILPFDINRRIVHQQFVFAVAQPGQNRADMRLRALVTVEIIAQLVAKRDDAEQFFPGGEIATFRRVEVFHRPPQLGEVGTDAGLVIHLADRAVEKTVGLASRIHDFLATHIGQLVNAFAEFGTVHVLRDQVGNIRLDAFFELGFLLIGYRH